MLGKKSVLMLSVACLPLLGTGAAGAVQSEIVQPQFLMWAVGQIPAPTPGSAVLLGVAALVVVLGRKRAQAIRAEA